MIPKIALFAMILRLAVCAAGQLPSGGVADGQAPDAVRGPHVVEAAAKATLNNDVIRVVLPLNTAAGPGVRIVAWLLSPKNARTQETAAPVDAGAREVAVSLDWRKIPGVISDKDIGWLRVGYRVEVNGDRSSHGILSVGAITANLIAMRLAYPAKIARGQSVSARVITINPVTGKGLANVKLKATLVDGDPDSKLVKKDAREAITGRNGEAILNFQPMGEPGDDLDLTVTGTLTGTAGALARDEQLVNIDVLDRTSVHVETDKPLHKPGETVHLRALAFKEGGRAAAGEPVTLTINDPENKKLVEAALTTNRFGIAAYDWKTMKQASLGDYEVSFDLNNATGENSTGTQSVRIQRYELPEFSVTATPDRAFYMNGEAPQVKIHAGYLFGKPVAEGSVRIVRADNAVWNPKTGSYDEPADVEENATLDVNGDATVSLKVADDFDQLKDNDWERFSDVKYRAMVTDATTGRTEPQNFVVRLTKEPVHIYLYPIGTNEGEGEYMLSTSFADGTPAPCKVTLDWMDAQSRATRATSATTNRYGLAKVTLHYPKTAGGDDSDRPQIRITARDKQGRFSHFDDSLWVNSRSDIWISLEHSILGPRAAIEGTLHGTPGEQVDIDVLSETSVMQHQQVRMGGAEQGFSIPASPAFHGLITLRAYNMRGEMPESRWYVNDVGASRTVLYPEDRSLSANVKGLATTYAPGAPVNAQLALRNATKGSVAGVFGVSVFDTAVEQRADTEADQNDRWFGNGWWWLGNLGVGDVTPESLNKVDASKPIDPDLDLAAEALLMDSRVNILEIESNDNSSVRNEYEQQMDLDVKPLRDAILAVNPEDLPATQEELKKFVEAAKLDPGVLLDPWDIPYRVELGEQWTNDVMTLHAAGPDKRFGTDDDFTLALLTRNIFTVPGARLNQLLQKTEVGGRPLPATVDELKKLALEGGLNLGSAQQHTLQRDGKPYTYTIDLAHRFYFVHVKRGADETVWESAGIDYFGRTEEKLTAALEKWAAAGNAFPETESDARRAFASAGVDFNALRDPLGRPFALRTKREFSYARIDKVKAGNTIQGETQKVTLVAQVIQVLRTDEKGASYGDLDEVARFAHTESQQSGSDLKPVAVNSDLFKGNTGAIGGIVTDQSGAIISGAKISVQNFSGDAVGSAISKDDGSYIVPDLAPGFYKVQVSAGGFSSFYLTDVHVSSSALTTVDVTLRVGAASETVTVTADAARTQTASSALASAVSGPSGRKSIVSGPNGSAVISEQAMTPRLRHVFDETAYWAPSLETSATGRAAIKFTLPDSLTTWKLHAVGSTVDGRITAIDQTFKTFQPFFVDLDAPQTLTVGDSIWLPVNLRNYMARTTTLPVTVKAADWFTLTTPATTQSTVAANGSAPVIVGLRATSATDAGPLRITAANAHDGDAVEKTVKVHPDGEPKIITASELLRGGTNAVALNLPQDTIPGSVHAELLLYPNLGANVYHAMKAVLERPYGCAEQTISSTYPSLLFLELETAAKHESQTGDQARVYLKLGYDRLLGYFSSNGGLTYWGGNDQYADAALTAYGIEFLTEAEPYIDVDRARIVSATQWLLAQQNADGAWVPRYSEYSARQTLYIAVALSNVLHSSVFVATAQSDLQLRVKQAIAKAQEYASHSMIALHDPYANALRLSLAAKASDTVATDRLRQELNSSAQRGRDGAFWEFDGVSPFYGWGMGGRLEATALALGALNAAGNEADKKLADDALLYLLRNRDGYGVWLSGQATVHVLKALLPLAISQLQNATPGDYTVTVNGKPLDPQQTETDKASSLIDAPRIVDLTALIHAGANKLEFDGTGDATFANAQITAWFYVPWAQGAEGGTKTTVPGKDFGLDFGYQCDAGEAKIGQPINCSVNARRFGSEGYGMMLAEVGLPPGADVDQASLGKLLDNWTIERYELQPDRVVFYLWSSAAEGEKFSFRFTPRYAIRAKAAPSKLIDYYNPELSAVLAPQSFMVSGAASR